MTTCLTVNIIFIGEFLPFRNMSIPAGADVNMKEIAAIIKFPGDNHFN